MIRTVHDKVGLLPVAVVPVTVVVPVVLVSVVSVATVVAAVVVVVIVAVHFKFIAITVGVGVQRIDCTVGSADILTTNHVF